MSGDQPVDQVRDVSGQTQNGAGTGRSLKVHGWVMALLGVALVGNLVLLDAVPRPFGDETWYAAPSLTLLQGDGFPAVPILPGRGGIAEAYLQPKVMLNIAVLPFIALFGPTLWALRLCTVVLGLLGVVVCYLLGLRFSRSVGLAAAVLMITANWFFIASRTFRPEITELLFFTLAILLVERSLDRKTAGSGFWAGTAIAAACLSHQIAALLTLLCCGYLVLTRRPNSARPLMAMAGGAALLLAPFVVYVLFASASTSASFWVQLGGEVARFEPTPWNFIVKEGKRLRNFFWLPWGALILALYLGGIVHGFASHKTGLRRLAWPLVISLAAIALVVPLPTGRYYVILIPLFSLLSAQLLLRLGQRRPWTGRVLVAGVALSLLGANLAVVYAHRNASFPEVSRRISAQVPGNAAVAGPILFWLNFRDRPYVVTNIGPWFDRSGAKDGDTSWLYHRMSRRRPQWVVQTTTKLQSTGGLKPRPKKLVPHVYNQALLEILQRDYKQVSTIASRDYGPITIWRLKPGHPHTPPRDQSTVSGM